ncbi:MAG: hypothetical protein Q4B60_07980 [Erysipelotrichaceae bacterium]|nr:hypothetical protein [Erysipelotrichaceae bacterium]
MLQKIRNSLYRFMYGRYGVDSLNKAIMIAVFVLLFIGMFTKGTVRLILSPLIWFLIFYQYFRMFSKNISKRYAENAWFESKTKYYKTRFSQMKEYKFFDCPKCHTHLRVPRGVGKITITCKKCGEKFDRKA